MFKMYGFIEWNNVARKGGIEDVNPNIPDAAMLPIECPKVCGHRQCKAKIWDVQDGYDAATNTMLVWCRVCGWDGKREVSRG